MRRARVVLALPTLMLPLLVSLLLPLLLPAVGAAREEGGPWFRREKVRCLAYLAANPQDAQFVGQVRALGFNCALVPGGVPAAGNPLLAAADRAGLRLIFTSNFLTREYLDERPEPDRRFQGSDGRVAGHLACPTDARYWQYAWGRQALALAELRRAGHPAAAGLLLDNEDYANMGDLMCGSLWLCYCDRCFGGFMQSLGRSDQVPAPQRQQWLRGGGLHPGYRRWQDERVVSILTQIRRQKISDVAMLVYIRFGLEYAIFY